MVSFNELSPQARVLWAKSGDDGSSGHSLLCHMLDVAAVAEVLLEREPAASRRWAADALGLEEPNAPRWVAALVGLHDFGKAIPGFQVKWSDGLQSVAAHGLPFSQHSLRVHNHSAATAALLPEQLRAVAGIEHGGWIHHVLQAISAHHGYNFLPREIADSFPGREGAGWGQARARLFQAYWSVLAPVGKPAREELSQPVVQWLAGLTAVADWIGSNTDWFPKGERHEDAAAYFHEARAKAVDALRAIGWSCGGGLEDAEGDAHTLVSRMLGNKEARARPLQEVADQLLQEANDPSLLLVEAPMGEGKTELAFLAHVRLGRICGHRGLYVALPTQATGNAIFGRLVAFLRAFAHEEKVDVQLVHGGAALNEEVIRLRGVFGAGDDSVASSAWFSQRRRPLLSPNGAGTVDQALFATLNVKHHFVRLWGLANKLVVFDEVHAYDFYTLGLIEKLLRWLQALGCSVVIMSATLPASRRARLLRAWSLDQAAVPDLPYPRVFLGDKKGIRGCAFAARPVPPVALRLVGEALEAIAAEALEALAHGGCGAVIVNTVDRAQALYRLLSESAPADARLMLFHARFPAGQRTEIEQTVLGCFGPDGQRPGRALLIATQVAEQSLDIDFDFMITDLAPVDLVLQRAGRLHRHVRDRPPAHATATLRVAGLDPAVLPDLAGTSWKFVYPPWLLGRTWAILSREQQLRLPEDIDRLVQAVYEDGDLPGDLDPQARDLIDGEWFGEWQAKQQTEQQFARNVAVDPGSEPQTAYADKCRGYEQGEEGIGLPNATRLGDDSISIVPVHRAGEGWAIQPDAEPFDSARSLPDAIAQALYRRQIRVSRKDLVQALQDAEAPQCFLTHPLLRHLKPLVLTEGECRLGRLVVRLDDTLGLLYLTDTAEKDYDGQVIQCSG